MIAEFICGFGSQTIAIIEFFAFVGIGICSFFVIKELRAANELLKLKSSWLAGGVYIITLAFLAFDAFGCLFF